MKTSSPKPEKPGFTTLSAIMDRFYEVPFELFQQELNAWLRDGFAGISPENVNFPENQANNFLEKLLAWGDRVFEEAKEA